MPTPAILLLTAALLPLIGFGLLSAFGRRLGNPMAGYVATALIGVSFVLSMGAMITWYQGGAFAGHAWGFDQGPINLPFHWAPGGSSPNDPGGWLDLGLFVDSLTIIMVSMVTLVATLVHIFSIGYMREDDRFSRFFAYLGLFCFSMLGLVLAGTLIHVLIFWEGVGLCSYLLIGFWYEKKTAVNAAAKAFIANRIGDAGMIVGIGIVLALVGNASFPRLWVALGHAGAGQPVILPDGSHVNPVLMTVAGIALFCGAIGKSAQFPLHVWLADAMEGPTPVSALIHAATMVAAGVYLVGRLFPILTPDARLFIAVIGVITIVIGAACAIAQTDIKKVLAFSTVSQLGYMMLAIGVGSWVGGLFHLVTHAFFKSLLFLAAGGVIRAARHEQEMGDFGGLIRKIPVTAVTFAVGGLALCGIGFGHVGLSGYYSKDLILAHAGAFADFAARSGHRSAYWLLFAVPVAAAFVTPFYMGRCWMLTFLGRPRNVRIYAGARETPIIWGPLVVLSVLAILSGRLMNITEMLDGSVHENTAYCRLTDPTFAGFDTGWPSTTSDEQLAAEPRDLTEVVPGAATAPTTGRSPKKPPEPTSSEIARVRGQQLLDRWLGGWGPLLGLLLACLLYANGPGPARAIVAVPPIRWVRTWLYHRMFFDELYFAVLVVPVIAIAKLTARLDRRVVDGATRGVAALTRRLARGVDRFDAKWVDGAVHGVTLATAGVGSTSRSFQTGRIRAYLRVLAVAAGTAVAFVAAIYYSG
jgi:NADH-quinone oxidoreductase subunit L